MPRWAPAGTEWNQAQGQEPWYGDQRNPSRGGGSRPYQQGARGPGEDRRGYGQRGYRGPREDGQLGYRGPREDVRRGPGPGGGTRRGYRPSPDAPRGYRPPDAGRGYGPPDAGPIYGAPDAGPIYGAPDAGRGGYGAGANGYGARRDGAGHPGRGGYALLEETRVDYALQDERRRMPNGGPGGRPGKTSRRRLRRFFRRRSVRAVGALVAVFFVWVAFSLGQALTAPGGGNTSARVAEWARDHNMGALVTFGEWLSYKPPAVGGKPSFSLAVPKGQSLNSAKGNGSFRPIIPQTLQSLAGSPLAGEGQWRVLESVKGEPAIFSTFLRDATYTSYVNGIVSMDQRLVKFQLHPGAQDPGGTNWGPDTEPWIPPGKRAGLLATFNGGFKLDAAGGGFYLNGHTHGTLNKGAASLVYYKNGSVKVGMWGRDVSMTPSVEGVRQNLKLVVDHGQVPSSVNSNVTTNWGATIGGSYYVWRSGLGITADGRLVWVYGQALNVADLAHLLQRAGAVEAMQMDINPYWMSYEYYTAGKHSADPTPANLLPTQQQSAYRYYSVYSRDFTAVYSR